MMGNWLSSHKSLKIYSERNSCLYLTATSTNPKKNRTTKMMALLMGTYYGFFLPQIINMNIEYDLLLKIYISTSLYVIYFLNALANPIIYAWFSPDFNRAFREILRLKPKNNKLLRNECGTVSTYLKPCSNITGQQKENTSAEQKTSNLKVVNHDLSSMNRATWTRQNFTVFRRSTCRTKNSFDRNHTDWREPGFQFKSISIIAI